MARPKVNVFAIAVFAANAAWLLGSCTIPSDPCVSGIESERRYRVDLLEVYDNTSTFTFDERLVSDRLQSCLGRDGVDVGKSVLLKALSQKGMHFSCFFHIGELEDRNRIHPVVVGKGSEGSVQIPGSGRFIALGVTHTLETKDGCTAQWDANVNAPGDDLLGTPVAGALPPAIFVRQMAGPGCTSCADYFAAKIEKLE